VVSEKVLSHLWVVGGCIVNCNTSLLCPVLHQGGINFATMGTKFPSTNYDALNGALGGSIGTTWNLWEFHKTVSRLFAKRRSLLRLHLCLDPMLSIFNLEHACSQNRLRPPWRDVVNYRARMHGVWRVAANTLADKRVFSSRPSSRSTTSASSSLHSPNNILITFELLDLKFPDSYYKYHIPNQAFILLNHIPVVAFVNCIQYFQLLH
jgi:hypothetical protein